MPRDTEEYVSPDLQEEQRRERALFREVIEDYLRQESGGRLRSGAQTRLAETIGVSPAWLSKFLKRDRGDLTLALMRRIAAATDRPLSLPFKRLGIQPREYLGERGAAALAAGLKSDAARSRQDVAAMLHPPLPPRLEVLIQEARRLPDEDQQSLIAAARGFAQRRGPTAWRNVPWMPRRAPTCGVCGRKDQAGLDSGGRCTDCATAFGWAEERTAMTGRGKQQPDGKGRRVKR